MPRAPKSLIPPSSRPSSKKPIKCQWCGFATCYPGNLRRHQWRYHSSTATGDKVWYRCNHCPFKTNTNYQLKFHLACKHNIGVNWLTCDICKKVCKSKQGLTSHKLYSHGIGGKPLQCALCDNTFKGQSDLNRHVANVHDIGKHKCQYCLGNRNSSIPFTSANGTMSKICRECFNKVTGKNSRVEKIWSDYLDEHIGTSHLMGSDASMRKLGGCQLYRPDKLYASPELVIIAECDEHQHAWHSGNYSCDEKRISDLFDEFGGTPMVVIRWNPDTYKVQTKESAKPKTRQERLQAVVRLFKEVSHNPPTDSIHIYYMYYNADNPRLSQNIPHTMLY